MLTVGVGGGTIEGVSDIEGVDGGVTVADEVIEDENVFEGVGIGVTVEEIVFVVVVECD